MDTTGVLAQSEALLGSPAADDQEVMWAQSMLDAYFDGSPFWDSGSGQEALAIAREHGLESRTSNWERRRYHDAIMRAARNPSEGEYCSHEYDRIPGGKGRFCIHCGWDE